MIRRFCSLVLLLTGSSGFSQKIAYTVSFPNVVHHEARIQVEVSGTQRPVLHFRMSRSSPGRYATHEFAKNVYDLEASDVTGKSIPVKRIDGDNWQLSGFKAPVRLRYTLYGNYADGTYNGIDPAGIHLNMPASFLWVNGLAAAPVSIRFNVPDTAFTIATQLAPTPDRSVFTAPNLQYFMDSPTKIGSLQWREWPATNGTTGSKMRLALEAEATPAQTDSLAANIRRITRQAGAVFGEYPVFDYGNYTFLASLNPYVYGDGMEHRNSTVITGGKRLLERPGALEVFAHEFFHCWNVERIRPATLEPFNFEKSNMSNELWCAEGFTQYYGGLLMVRAGLQPDTGYGQLLAGLVNAKQNTPGAAKYTPLQASNLAVFTDAGSSVDKTNYPNIFTSYYTYGGALALALDLSLRQQGKNLDAFMRQLWKTHGKTEKPYTVADLQTALATITDARFAKTFFDTYVYAPGKPDYAALLARAGFDVRKAAPGKAWIGPLRFAENRNLVIASNTLRGTPLYEAGLDIGDQLTALDGTPVSREADLVTLLAAHRPGDRLTLSYRHRNKNVEATITAAEDPWLTVVPYEQTGQPITDAIKAFRSSWLGAQ